MALAGIDALLIRASYTQRPAESRCPGPSRRTGAQEGAVVRAVQDQDIVHCDERGSMGTAGPRAGHRAFSGLVSSICQMELVPTASLAGLGARQAP